MKKEEILEMSKKENQKKDPYVLEVQSKAGNIATAGMLILAFIYLIYEMTTTSHWNPAIYSIITLYNSLFWGYNAIKIEKTRKINTFSSIMWGIFTILLLLDYFKVF